MKTKPVAGQPERVNALEGLRGVAAITVVCFHALISLFPVAFYGPAAHYAQHSRFEDNFFYSPLIGLFNGLFAVAVFFVLSGFVLSIGFFNEKDTLRAYAKNLNQTLKRYLRLTIPALGSVVIAYLLLRTHLNFNQSMFLVTDSPRLHEFWAFAPDLWGALYQGVYGMFSGSVTYNPVLWTMQWEFLGSMMVFAFLGVFGRSPARGLGYAVLIALTYKTYLLGFVLGMIVADLHARRRLPRTNLLLSAILGVGIVTISSLYLIKTPAAWQFALRLVGFEFFWLGLAALAALYVCLTNPQINRLLSHRYMVRVGNHTFSLYLLHDILILTVLSYVFPRALNHLPYTVAAGLSLLAFGISAAACTFLYNRYVDQWSITVSRAFAARLQSGRPIISLRGFRRAGKDLRLTEPDQSSVQ